MSLSQSRCTLSNRNPTERSLYKKDAGVTRTSESTIHRAIKSRRLKAAFIGRRVVIRGAELLKWLAACQEERGEYGR
ncbi:MAG: helix-turn-helix domain-containing protein [Acidobacteria bacterium]|nr:helix-turn-helix domain-containing protein [Acidobacteriota bacterium]